MENGSDGKRTVVIGAGLGGLSAAVSLASAGYPVDVFEKNDHVGGKLNRLEMEGFSFDLGPSILTLPHYFRRLWARAGKNMDDEISLKSVNPHWRNLFEDGTVTDLYIDPVMRENEVRKLGGEKAVQRFRRYLSYSAKQYDIAEQGYFEQGFDTASEMIKFYDAKSLIQYDYWTTMHKRNAKLLKNRYLIDIMDYFIKYVGSSALRAPAFMNLMPTIQFRYDLWYVTGGMYELARAMEKLARELGVSIHLNTEITRIDTREKRVRGVATKEGAFHEADVVVSNMEVIPAYQRLLDEDDGFMQELDRFAPACSGLVLHIGTDKEYPQLAHHNFVYSRNQEQHFKSVFEKGVIPDDPTLYVVAPSRSDKSVCPPGCDNIKILPHIPPIDPHKPVTHEQYRALRDRVLDKMGRVGLEDLRDHIIVEHLWTPVDIEKNYYSNRGSIYGVVSDKKQNLGLKAPKKSPRYENLYFVGGSVNPGGGMPMVVLSGQNAARMIIDRYGRAG